MPSFGSVATGPIRGYKGLTTRSLRGQRSGRVDYNRPSILNDPVEVMCVCIFVFFRVDQLDLASVG